MTIREITIATVTALLLAASPADASTISFNGQDRVASIHTRGEYDDAGLGTWNGQPLSPTNHPSFEEDQLSADWNLYVLPAMRNVLFVEATNIHDTTYGFIFGTPFSLVALTGFELAVPEVGGGYLVPSAYSNDWARPGEALDGRPLQSDPPHQVPLLDTPNWSSQPRQLDLR
jgi:hypothetical protein